MVHANWPCSVCGALTSGFGDTVCWRHRRDATPGASLGQLAYEEDVRREPNYPNGAPRRPWGQLEAILRDSWEREPTPRAQLKLFA